MNIIFYNLFHNGDIHNSRGLISHIMKNMGEDNSFFYKHVNGPRLLADVNITYIKEQVFSNELIFYHNEHYKPLN